MKDWKDKYLQFKEWQKVPHHVKPMSQEEHECPTCNTRYKGNYCPRCGQSFQISRYSFKTAFLLFLDVWGLGNRGMFRSIRDLLLRPGYMIRDYLSGMQMAYFPPFKMFFLLATLSVLIDSGLNVKRLDTINKAKENIAVSLKDNQEMTEKTEKTEEISEEEMKQRAYGLKIDNTVKTVTNWIMDHQTIFQLLWLIVLSAPLYLFFRHSPSIPDIRYSEFFVAMVYITNMMTIINVVFGFFMPGNDWPQLIPYLLSVLALSQLSGYTFKRSLFMTVTAFALLSLVVIIISVAVGFLAVFWLEG
ncbi:MAG: DUF3667 domain-containing protein [Prevotella sp.]|nr:DUF3667 domain-containing protein [Prevotella sp.]